MIIKARPGRSGFGQGRGNPGRGHGQRGGSGPGGNCVCPACGYKTSHPRGTPCNQIPCPKCGTTMVRE